MFAGCDSGSVLIINNIYFISLKSNNACLNIFIYFCRLGLNNSNKSFFFNFEYLKQLKLVIKIIETRRKIFFNIRNILKLHLYKRNVN